MAGQGLSISEETKIVALIARGDTYAQIQTYFPNRNLDQDTITKVKKRNKENLDLIRASMQETALEQSLANKQKANKIIGNKLDKIESVQEQLDKAHDDWVKDKITFKEYSELIRKLKDTSLTELVTVSREMHNQSKEETPASTNPQDMAALAAALKSGDELTLNQLIWKPHDSPVPPQGTST